MIKYSLICAAGAEKSPPEAHEFECWFPSSSAYEDQSRRGLVTCPICDSPRVSKAIMAPNVARTDVARLTPPAPANGDAPAERHDVVIADDNMRRLHAMIRELREKILEGSRDVGAAFPEEARKMHAGETEEAPIRGQASLEEARALLEEGIEVMPIPSLPEDRN
jgi:hypothetical protein